MKNRQEQNVWRYYKSDACDNYYFEHYFKTSRIDIQALCYLLFFYTIVNNEQSACKIEKKNYCTKLEHTSIKALSSSQQRSWNNVQTIKPQLFPWLIFLLKNIIISHASVQWHQIFSLLPTHQACDYANFTLTETSMLYIHAIYALKTTS